MRTFVLARLCLVAALPLAVLIAACGGGSDKKVDADDWVADLCEVALDFADAGDEAGEEFMEADFEDTKEAKKAFASSVKKQKEAQEDFRSDFDKLGQPDIEDGDKVVKAFEQQFDENDEFTDEVADAVADMDDDDDFFTAFLEIIDDNPEPDFREKLEDLADDSDEVEDLVATIDDDEDCAEVIFDSDEVSASDESTPTSKSPTPVITIRTPSATRSPAPANTANEKWVSGICVAFTGWVNDLEKANMTLQTGLNTAKTAPELKKLLVDFMKAGQTETKNLQKEVTALKAPDVKDGAAIHKVFVDASAELVKTFDGFVSDAEKVGTASLAQVEADVERLSAKIDVAFDEIGESFDKLDQYNVPAIENLFDTRPECAGL